MTGFETDFLIINTPTVKPTESITYKSKGSILSLILVEIKTIKEMVKAPKSVNNLGLKSFIINLSVLLTVLTIIVCDYPFLSYILSVRKLKILLNKVNIARIDLKIKPPILLFLYFSLLFKRCSFIIK